MNGNPRAEQPLAEAVDLDEVLVRTRELALLVPGGLGGEVAAPQEDQVQGPRGDEREPDRGEIEKAEPLESFVLEEAAGDDIGGRQQRRHAPEDRPEGEGHQEPGRADPRAAGGDGDRGEQHGRRREVVHEEGQPGRNDDDRGDEAGLARPREAQEEGPGPFGDSCPAQPLGEDVDRHDQDDGGAAEARKGLAGGQNARGAEGDDDEQRDDIGPEPLRERQDHGASQDQQRHRRIMADRRDHRRLVCTRSAPRRNPDQGVTLS